MGAYQRLQRFDVVFTSKPKVSDRGYSALHFLQRLMC